MTHTHTLEDLIEQLEGTHLNLNANNNNSTMDTTQFTNLITALNTALAPLTNLTNTNTSTNTNTNTGTATTSTPRLSVKLPVYRGDAGENIYMWCMQLGAIFSAQGITDATIRIHYASTALEGGALHWYLN